VECWNLEYGDSNILCAAGAALILFVAYRSSWPHRKSTMPKVKFKVGKGHAAAAQGLVRYADLV
jgi:hypothetical protein